MSHLGADLTGLCRQLCRYWRSYLATHVLCTLLAYTILLPLLTALIDASVAMSGQQALSDQQILLFVASPAGLLTLFCVGSVGLLTLVFRLSALLVVSAAAENGTPIGALAAIRTVARRGRRVMALGIPIVLRALQLLLPWALALWLIFLALLNRHDINYYLFNKPWQFWLAAALAAVVTAILVWQVLRTLISWFYALALVIFTDSGARAALAQSRQTSRGHTARLLAGLLSLILIDALLLVAISGLIHSIGQLLIPAQADGFDSLATRIAALMILAAALGMLARATSLSLLSAFMVRAFVNAGFELPVHPVAAAGTSGTALHWTASRLAVAALAAFAVALWLGKSRIDALVVEREVEVIAHRGASAVAPENTMAAIEAALEAGTDWVEIDVQENADGEVVVIHDRDLKKVAGVSLSIHEASTAALADIDIGSWFDVAFSNQRVPTLREVLELCRGRAGVLIELKYYGHQVDLEGRVAAVVEQTQMEDAVQIMSLDSAGITRMHALRPDWPLGILTSLTAGKLQGLPLDFYAINARTAARSFVRSAHAREQKVMVWTVNDRLGMSTMISRGADGLITDYPELARSVIRERRSMDPSERLLLEAAKWLGYQAEYEQQ